MQTPVHKPFLKSTSCIAKIVLFVVVLAVFLPAIRNGFTTYDDPEYVTANPYVKSGLTAEGFRWAFAAHGANWHPLTWLVHIFEGQLFDLRPWAHHLVNVLFHTINTLLVFSLLRKLTGAIGRSFVVALLFGLHPLRVESVAWVSELKDVLSTFFWMLSLLAYTEYAQKTKSRLPNNRRVFYGLSLITFVLGLLSKSMVVTLPCVLLLLDAWPLERWKEKKTLWLIVEKLPYFLFAAMMSAIAYVAQYRGTAMVSTLPFNTRLANALISYCRYLGKIFWPKNLSPIYPYVMNWPLGLIWGAALFLAAVSVLAIWLHKRFPYFAFGWFWFLGTLMPVIGLVQVGDQSMADRYSYIPSFGILVAVVWGIAEIIKKRPSKIALATIATAAAALALTIVTEKQIGYWKNTETLFQHAVDVTDNNTLALVGLGDCLAEHGKFDDAIVRYRQALDASPNYFEAHDNLGLALLSKGNVEDAIGEFHNAIQSRPGAGEGYMNLGTALVRKGSAQEAIGQFEHGLQIEPNNPLFHSMFGNLLLANQRFEEAAQQFKLACDFSPNDPLLHYSFATALMNLKNLDVAIVEFRNALKFAPNNASIHNDLGTALAMQGKLDDAANEFQAALAIDPNQQKAKENMAKVMKMKK